MRVERRALSYDARGNLAGETRTGEAALSFTCYGMDDRIREVRGTNTLQSRRRIRLRARNIWRECQRRCGAIFRGPALMSLWLRHTIWSTTLGDRPQFAADDLSGVIAVGNPADLVCSRFAYGEQGEPSQQSGSAFLYTGQRIIPGIDLYHHKARTYLFNIFSWHAEYTIAANDNPN